MSTLQTNSARPATDRTHVSGGVEIHYELSGAAVEQAETLIGWGHGWGQDRTALKLLSTSIKPAAHVLIDFPGFGKSPPPPSEWGTAEYADTCKDLLLSLPFRGEKRAWVGHSFGGRVGIQMAARHREFLRGLCLIAAAGLPRRRRGLEAARYWSRVYASRLIKTMPMASSHRDWLRSKLGSADYQRAGALRPVFVRVVNEDLTEAARHVQCDTLLIYAARDTETPTELGERLSRLIPRSELVILENNDHYSLLGSGRHLVAKRLDGFLHKL